MHHKNEGLPSLSELQKKIDEASGTKGGEDGQSGDTSSMRLAMRLGVELVAGTAVGGIAGYLLDRWLDTLPVFFVLCFFFGFAGGLRNVLHSIARQDDADQR